MLNDFVLYFEMIMIAAVFGLQTGTQVSMKLFSPCLILRIYVLP